MTALPGSNQTVRCAVCAAEFACGADAADGCWCAGLPRLPAHALTTGGCLCEACLRWRLECQAEGPAMLQPATR